MATKPIWTKSEKKLIGEIKGLLEDIADHLKKHPPHQEGGRAGQRLAWYWRIGRAANDILEGSRDQYGTHVIDRLAEDVRKGYNWIRAYQRFNSYFSWQDVNRAIRDNLSWRHVQALLLLQDNRNLRNRLWNRVVRRRLSGRETFRLVRQEARRAADRNVRRRAQAIDAQFFHAAIRRCGPLLQWLQDIRDWAPRSDALVEESRPEVAGQAQEALDAIGGLRTRLTGAFRK